MIGQAERLYELNHLYKKEDKAVYKNNIIAFTSGKGGTGKTIISLNTAFGSAIDGKKVLYIDLDLNFANAAIMLNIYSESTIIDFFKGSNNLSSLIYKYHNNLHFIFGDSGRLDFPKVDKGSIFKLFNEIQQLSDKYDLIIIDTGAGAAEETLEILLNSAITVIISSTEPTSIMDCYVIHKLLKFNNYKGVKSVIINRCENEKDGENAFRNLTTAVNHFIKEPAKLIGLVNDDVEISRSIKEQKIFISRNPASTTAMQIKKISKNIYDNLQLVNINQIKK
ncbi:MAG: AAA family ATPase [Bacteroidota bacterium]|nr:AAA family ATPase [Bacteroidota bacterium]